MALHDCENGRRSALRPASGVLRAFERLFLRSGPPARTIHQSVDGLRRRMDDAPTAKSQSPKRWVLARARRSEVRAEDLAATIFARSTTTLDCFHVGRPASCDVSIMTAPVFLPSGIRGKDLPSRTSLRRNVGRGDETRAMAICDLAWLGCSVQWRTAQTIRNELGIGHRRRDTFVV